MSIEHTIKNQHDKYIYGKYEIEEILHMLENDLDYTYINDNKVSLVKDYKKEDGTRETIVQVEGM